MIYFISEGVAMIDEKRIKELAKRIDSLDYSETIPKNTKSPKTDLSKLKKLAKEIRKTVEDYPVENPTHTNTGVIA